MRRRSGAWAAGSGCKRSASEWRDAVEPGASSELDLCEAGGGLDPAEHFLDALAAVLADLVTDVSCGASIDDGCPRRVPDPQVTIDGGPSGPAISPRLSRKPAPAKLMPRPRADKTVPLFLITQAVVAALPMPLTAPVEVGPSRAGDS